MVKLRELNGEFRTLLKEDGSVNTDEKQTQYRELSKELMNLLIEYVPGFLQKEDYFVKAFPTR